MALNLDAALVLLSEREREVYNRIRVALEQTVGRLWDAHGGVSDADLARFLRSALPAVEASQNATVALVRSYVAQVLQVAGQPGAEAVLGAELAAGTPRGVSLAEVYARPVTTARGALAKGEQWVEAMAKAFQRAQHLAGTDMALTQRRAFTDALTTAARAGARVVGYRRTLTGASCIFCATASTQRYHYGDLMPLHGHCDCGVSPIIGDTDPGRIINREVYRQLKAQGPEYWKRKGWVDEDGTIMTPETARERGIGEVAEHGELGPTFAETMTKL